MLGGFAGREICTALNCRRVRSQRLESRMIERGLSLGAIFRGLQSSRPFSVFLSRVRIATK